MSAPRVLPQASVEFRALLIQRLWTDEAFGYVTEDVFIGRCPICGDHVEVKFHGLAARADLHCQLGCPESEIADVLELEVRP